MPLFLFTPKFTPNILNYRSEKGQGHKFMTPTFFVKCQN